MAISLITEHIKMKVGCCREPWRRCAERRHVLSNMLHDPPQLLTLRSLAVLQLQQHDLRRIFHNLQVIPSNFQIRGMHTIIRDRTTSCADFVFYADRLLRLVVEAGAMRMQLSPADLKTTTCGLMGCALHCIV